MDLLMPYKETEAYGMPFTRPPLVIDSKEEYEVKAIIDSRRSDGDVSSNTLCIGRGTLTLTDYR
jgi:hypothetical protein